MNIELRLRNQSLWFGKIIKESPTAHLDDDKYPYKKIVLIKGDDRDLGASGYFVATRYLKEIGGDYTQKEVKHFYSEEEAATVYYDRSSQKNMVKPLPKKPKKLTKAEKKEALEKLINDTFEGEFLEVIEEARKKWEKSYFISFLIDAEKEEKELNSIEETVRERLKERNWRLRPDSIRRSVKKEMDYRSIIDRYFPDFFTTTEVRDPRVGNTRTYTYKINEEEIRKTAKGESKRIVRNYLHKMASKIGVAKDLKVWYANARGEITITGKVGNLHLEVRQQVVHKWSSKRRPFVQFPARIYVDGKFTPEKKFKEIVKELTTNERKNNGDKSKGSNRR